MAQIFENKEMKEGQIKDEKQLTELIEVIDFSSKQFHEYEKDREEQIKALEDFLIKMTK